MHNIHARASEVPLTEAEITTARNLLAQFPICVATLQRRMRIGYARAADLIVAVKGFDLLPNVAKKLF